LAAGLSDGVVDPSKIISSSRILKFSDEQAGVPVSSAMAFPVTDLVQTFKPEAWEDFTEEWAHSQEKKYTKVIRYTGAGDMGLDILCFYTDKFFDGPWDNVQCKRYACQLQPAQVNVELGKIIYYSFLGQYPPPEKYYFAASKGLGLSLKKLLTKPKDLKEQLRSNWDKHCQAKITDTALVPLSGKLLEYFEQFDFSIFSMITVAEMVKAHANTVFYQRRFGGDSFPERPPIMQPPVTLQQQESRYVQQLFEVYSEKLSQQLNEPAQLAKHPDLERHFNRSREIFYHAESLRNFPRDSVDPGAFEAIQDEIYHGCVDVYDMEHGNGMERVLATVSQAATLHPNCNALCVRVQTKDKQGLCHHLANQGRFTWVKKNA
jgi:hypothetical protein